MSFGPSIYMVKPLTDRCRDWVEDHVPLEPWQWLGEAFSVEHRFIDALVAGMVEDGLGLEEDFTIFA